MKSTSYIIVIFLIMILLNGCGVLGKNLERQSFDAAGLDTLVIGRTTALKVSTIFGAPTSIVKLSNGNAYIYRRSVAKGTVVWLIIVSLGNYDKQYDQIVFFFDKKNILTHYGASFNAEKASYGFPF